MATPAKSPAPQKKTNGKAGNGAWVGKRIKRKEDPRMIRGISHYTDDLKLAGMVHRHFSRPPNPHAGINALHPNTAKTVHGGIAGNTSSDKTSRGPAPRRLHQPR